MGKNKQKHTQRQQHLQWNHKSSHPSSAQVAATTRTVRKCVSTCVLYCVEIKTVDNWVYTMPPHTFSLCVFLMSSGLKADQIHKLPWIAATGLMYLYTALCAHITVCLMIVDTSRLEIWETRFFPETWISECLWKSQAVKELSILCKLKCGH